MEPEAAPPKNKVQDLQDQVDGVKRVMTDNVERILARGERLDDLMDKTSELQDGVSVCGPSHVCPPFYPTRSAGMVRSTGLNTTYKLKSLNFILKVYKTAL